MKRLVETINDNTIRITIADRRWYIKDKDPYASVTWMCSVGYPKGIPFYKWLADKGWNESQAIKSAAGIKGSKVHQAIEDLIDGKEIPMDAKYWVEDNSQTEELELEEYECLMSFIDWYKTVKPNVVGDWDRTTKLKVIAKELTVFSEQYKYAGTIDLICELKDKLYIIDFKSGQNIWPEYKLQLSAYKHAYIEQEGETKDVKLAVLQLGYKRNKRGWKFTEIDDCFDLFLAAREIWKNECATQKPLVKDYPMSLKLEEK